MRISRVMLAASLVLGAASTVHAQDKPTTYVFGTYYQCSQGDAARADAIFSEHEAPLLKAAVASGSISAYGYLKHAEGGAWRRAFYITGTDIGKISDAREALTKAMQTPEHIKAFEEFGHICGSHDDYIWRAVASSQAPNAVAQTRAAFGMSTYFICTSDETEADADFQAAYVPVLNERVKDGSITSWSWIEHIFGGVYRRALVLDGKDTTSLLKNWATLTDTVEKQSPALSRRFSAICDRHADYIWEVGTPK